MFERYSERARRSIFWARYEASSMPTGFIETEHLLLGLMREDLDLKGRLAAVVEPIRQQVVARLRPAAETVSTSVDMPLSHRAKRALTHAADEAEKLGHRTIDTGHLILGLLREEECGGAVLLREHGIDYQGYRKFLDRPEAPAIPEAAPPPRVASWERIHAKAPSLRPVVERLTALTERAATHLESYSEADAAQRLKPRTWTRKEALGHLIDWAATHQQWFARALTEPKLVAAMYPQEEWVTAQNYASVPWDRLVELWVRTNGLLAHAIAQVPEEKLSTACKVGIQDAILLYELIGRYVGHCEDVIAQILTRS